MMLLTSFQYAVFFLLFLLSVVIMPINAWDYTDPNTWQDQYSKCAGKFQSPIALSPGSSIYNEELELELSYKVQDKIFLDVNDKGITVAFHNSTLPGSPTECLTSGSFIEPAYRLEQMHFHWDQEGNAGSEHTINGTQAVLEAHFVHFRTDLGSVARAINQEKGLLVVGVNFYLDTAASAEGCALLDDLAHIVASTGQTSDIKLHLDDANLDLQSVLPPTFYEKFYTYQGSLTTPTCDESVTWIVAADASSINVQQLEMFRSLMKTDGTTPIAPNYRPLQDLNARIALRSFSIPADTADSCDTNNNNQEAQWKLEGKNIIIPFYAASVLFAFLLLTTLKVCEVYYSYCCGSSSASKNQTIDNERLKLSSDRDRYMALHSSHAHPSLNESSSDIGLL